jgi:uncharacterized protein YjbI with pentapeptide repeats
MAAIVDLESLVIESRDNVRRVVSQLCAFLRNRAVKPSRRRRATDGEIRKAVSILRSQLLVLRRRERVLIALDLQHPRLQDGSLIDLNGTWLPEEDFSGLNLAKSRFQGAHLEGADYRDSNLRGAHFNHASLSRAIFGRADISGADFRGSGLEGATFFKANTEATDFRGVDLGGAISLTRLQLAAARTNQDTIRPTDLVDPSVGDFMRDLMARPKRLARRARSRDTSYA